MASENSNNLNNKDNVKLKFTGENAKVNAEVKLDDFEIEDIEPYFSSNESKTMKIGEALIGVYS